jgi:hypothetical protein
MQKLAVGLKEASSISIKQLLNKKFFGNSITYGLLGRVSDCGRNPFKPISKATFGYAKKDSNFWFLIESIVS